MAQIIPVLSIQTRKYVFMQVNKIQNCKCCGLVRQEQEL